MAQTRVGDTILERPDAPVAGRAIPAAAPRVLRWLDRLPSADRLTIAVILVVVALVTVPIVRRVALRQNERDALRSLVLLARAQERVGARDLPSLFAAAPELADSLPDTRVLPDGRVLRHGYLIALEPTPKGPQLLAWPRRYGRSGLGAFRWTPDGRLEGDPNEDGLAEGPRPPAAGADWRPLRIQP